MIFDLQKASMSKRISAFLFDFIIFCVITVALALLLSAILGYDARHNEYEALYNKYEEEYGIDTEISAEKYEALSDEEKAKYEEASKAMSEDEELIALYTIIMNLTLITASFSILLSFVILEVVLPLILKNGQTLGKKIFGIAVMRTDGVKISPLQVFVRAIIGKFTIETMIPVFLLLLVFFGVIGTIGLLIIAILLTVQAVIMILTRTNSMIHDCFAVTVTVDYASQMIFNSESEMIEYKKKVAEQKAREQAY